MHQNVCTEPFRWRVWHLHFKDFFLKKGGTLKQGSRNYTPNEFISWEQGTRVQGTLGNIMVPTKLSPGGGAGIP